MAGFIGAVQWPGCKAQPVFCSPSSAGGRVALVCFVVGH